MSSFRLRCKIPHGPDYHRRIAAVENAANRIRSGRSLFVRVVPTSGGVFCDLYLYGTHPPDAGAEFALKTTGETFTREIIP
jgi:hypothetical protein